MVEIVVIFAEVVMVVIHMIHINFDIELALTPLSQNELHQTSLELKI